MGVVESGNGLALRMSINLLCSLHAAALGQEIQDQDDNSKHEGSQWKEGVHRWGRLGLKSSKIAGGRLLRDIVVRAAQKVFELRLHFVGFLIPGFPGDRHILRNLPRGVFALFSCQQQNPVSRSNLHE